VALGLIQPLTEINKGNLPGGVKSSWNMRLTASSLPVCQVYRICGIFDVSQPYRPIWPVTWRQRLAGCSTYANVTSSKAGNGTGLAGTHCNSVAKYAVLHNYQKLILQFIIITLQPFSSESPCIITNMYCLCLKLHCVWILISYPMSTRGSWSRPLR
jgi:hypothetical protein